MTVTMHEKDPYPPVALAKADPSLPALVVTGPTSVAIRAGTQFAERIFAADTPVPPPACGLAPGTDYVVVADPDTGPAIVKAAGRPAEAFHLGGFHFAPGGNAIARAGGDAVPQINPCSVWDRNFRPACPDPGGMTRVVCPDRKPFWIDIYLLAQDHRAGTSRHGATIASGVVLPGDPAGGRFDRLDYPAAVAVFAHHGKQLLSYAEFVAAANGVTERSAADRRPVIAGLDAPRTSRFGVMQATGNLLVWGTDDDPDDPRPSFFGGSWVLGSVAGSRYAFLGRWPGYSYGDLGARGRSDHLQLG